jgi:CheY-like chemotaxis protein
MCRNKLMSALANRLILVVEDEFLIAAALCDMLEDASAIVIGPAVSVGEAMQLLQDHDVEGAILDMNLNGQWSDPIAEELKTRLIPFVFTTGYGKNERTERFGVRTVTKPYAWEEIEEQLGKAMFDRGAP